MTVLISSMRREGSALYSAADLDVEPVRPSYWSSVRCSVSPYFTTCAAVEASAASAAADNRQRMARQVVPAFGDV